MLALEAWRCRAEIRAQGRETREEKTRGETVARLNQVYQVTAVWPSSLLPGSLDRRVDESR